MPSEEQEEQTGDKSFMQEGLMRDTAGMGAGRGRGRPVGAGWGWDAEMQRQEAPKGARELSPK